MRARGQRGPLLIGFLASFLLVGIPYWIIPYNALNLPDALMGFGLVAVVLAALALRAWTALAFWKTTLVVGASVPAAVLARVLMDGMADPTSHNLWPFEVAIALGVGFAPALAGAIGGSLLAKFIPSRARDEQP
jgi:hypothetical protein